MLCDVMLYYSSVRPAGAQTHVHKACKVFEGVSIKKGSKLTVVSNIGSADGAEYSRGRWGGIVLVPAGKGGNLIDAVKGYGTQTNVGNHVAAAKVENVTPEISGELKKWHKVTLTFDGPASSEEEEFNPFMNYRFNVEFTHEASGKKFMVPGYFAADGDAGNSSATSGNKWRVHFAP